MRALVEAFLNGQNCVGVCVLRRQFSTKSRSEDPSFESSSVTNDAPSCGTTSLGTYLGGTVPRRCQILPRRPCRSLQAGFEIVKGRSGIASTAVIASWVVPAMMNVVRVP